METKDNNKNKFIPNKLAKTNKNITGSKGIHHKSLINQLEHSIGPTMLIYINIFEIN